MITETVLLNNADEVLRQIEMESERRFLPIVGPNKGKILAQEIRKAKPRHVLEVGTLIGYSAILIGKELDVNAELVTLEIHRGEAKTAGKNILKANIPAKVKIITGDAIDVIPTLRGPFDFVFIDASKSEYFQYLCLAENKLCRGAVVVADNVVIFAEQMSDYLDYVRHSVKYKSRFVPVGIDGMEISIKL